MTADPFVEFKKNQREGWRFFAPIEVFTTQPAANLVRFANIQAGQEVLDVATGTGVAAITARRCGAKVTGLDLTPALLEHAKENAAIAELSDIKWLEGDAEELPFADASFDVVVSQFGHMFAPRAEIATRELLRVLRPGGTVAFSTWPPEHFVGQMFALVGSHLPPPPAGMSPPPQWGNPAIIAERLGSAVTDLFFERQVAVFPALSPQHYFANISKTAGPVVKLLQSFEGQPEKINAFRQQLTTLVSRYYSGNGVRQDYLMTRAVKQR